MSLDQDGTGALCRSRVDHIGTTEGAVEGFSGIAGVPRLAAGSPATRVGSAAVKGGAHGRPGACPAALAVPAPQPCPPWTLNPYPRKASFTLTLASTSCRAARRPD